MKSQKRFYIQNHRTGKVYGSFAKEETACKYANKMYSNSLRKGTRSMRHTDTLEVYSTDGKGNFKTLYTYHE